MDEQMKANMNRRKSIMPPGRNRQNQKSVAGESINLAARAKTKRRQWKVTVAPEVEEEDEEERKEIIYTKPQFDSDKIYQLIAEIVEKTFVVEEDEEEEKQPYVYNASENVNLCQQISKEIRERLKTWRQLLRYRIVALTSVVEKNHQGIHYKMKYLVDPKTDNFVKYYLDHPKVYIIVLVVLIFQD